MAIGTNSPERLVAEQTLAIAGFFGTEAPTPPDRLFRVAEKIRELKLFEIEPFYLPGCRLREGLQYPGLKVPLSPWFYEQIREGRIAGDADMLPGQWVLFDVSGRPNYDNGKQMYPGSAGLGEILVDLRDQGKITVPDGYGRVPRNSRFAVSADEIDGRSNGCVVKAVAFALSLRPGEKVTTPPYVVFNCIGNLAHPEFGAVDGWEWFADSFGRVERGHRLFGGDSGGGGLAFVDGWLPDVHHDGIGFRLQISFPANT